LLDLAGAPARQRDLLAIASTGSVAAAQMSQQPLLVGVGERVVGGALADTGGLQLLEQCRRRAIELGGELSDGCHGHYGNPCLLGDAVLRAWSGMMIRR
jgi:hypothetical protein